MDENIFNALEPIMVERMNDAFNKSMEYQQAVAKEGELYENLQGGVAEELRGQLEEYFALSSATTAISEKIAYIQGMKDMAAILFQK